MLGEKMKTVLISLLLSIFLSTIALASDDPKWSELNNLFGKKISSPEVKKLVKIHNLLKAAKGDSGSFSPKNMAYSLMFRGNAISTIILKTSPWPEGSGEKHWREFKGELPAKIKRTHLRKDIIEMFGKSHTKKGDTWISEDLKIWIFFNENTGTVDELCISKGHFETPNLQDTRKNE